MLVFAGGDIHIFFQSNFTLLGVLGIAFDDVINVGIPQGDNGCRKLNLEGNFPWHSGNRSHFVNACYFS